MAVIDGCPLDEMLMRVEAEQVGREPKLSNGDPRYRGANIWQQTFDQFLERYLTTSNGDFGEDLLRCWGCGEAGCDGYHAQIDVADDVVTWRDFEHYQLDEDDGFNPDVIGPFVFARQQYEQALHDAWDQIDRARHASR